MGNKTIRHINTYKSYHFRNATDDLANNSEDEVQMTIMQLEAAVRESRTSSTVKVQSNPPSSPSLTVPGSPSCLQQNCIIVKAYRKKSCMQDLEYHTSKFKRSDHHFLLHTNYMNSRGRKKDVLQKTKGDVYKMLTDLK